MPPWSKRNVINCVRLLGSEWTFRVLDKVDGYTLNTSHYIDQLLIAISFSKGTMDGHFVGEHTADLTRCACFFLYGGVWLAVGNLLLTHLDDLCYNALKHRDSPHELCTRHMEQKEGRQLVRRYSQRQRDCPPFAPGLPGTLEIHDKLLRI